MRERILTPVRASCHTLGVILLSCALLSGCGGSYAEYNPKSPWIGTRATFGPAMAYISNLPNDYGDKETLRIGRAVNTLERAEEDKRYERTMREVMITSIPAGTTVEVVSVFTVVYRGLSRLFVEDYDIVVLKDDRGITSTMLLSEFQYYAKERTGGPTGGLKK